MIDQQDIIKVKALSPTAARIFIIILLGQGQAFTGRQLAALLGKTEGTISLAVRELEVSGMAQYNGYSDGWSIPMHYQLSIEEFLKNRKLLDEVFEKSKTLPPYSSLVSGNDPGEEEITTNQLSPGVFEKSKTPQADEPESTEVAAWLAYGGIIKNSPKMILLAQKIQSPEYVKAHVLEHLHERRAWEKAGKRNREPGTGSLIYRLEKGWDAPPMRCEDCLEREKDCRCNGRSFRQRIPDDLKGIVKR
jgi:hypothetical protein